MRYRIAAPAVALVLLLLAVAGAKAQTSSNTKSKQKGQPAQTASNKSHGASLASEPVFSTEEITIVQDYFKTHSPGLAKHQELSAAQDKQLVKHAKLPSSLKKKAQPLPIELERQLTVLPSGYRRVAISSHVIVMSSTNGMICDVIRDVIP